MFKPSLFAVAMRQQRQKKTTVAADHLIGTEKSLATVEKLLNTAFKLLQQHSLVDKRVIEQLRQLRVRVRQSLSALSPPTKSLPPLAAPLFWKDRPEQSEGPIEFVKRVYGPWIGRKDFGRANIKRLDKKLYDAIYNLDNPSGKLAELGLLTRRQISDLKIGDAGRLKRPSKTRKMSELTGEDKEAARLYYLLQRRRQRAEKQ